MSGVQRLRWGSRTQPLDYIGTVPASSMDFCSGSNHHKSLVVKMIGPTTCGRSQTEA